VLRKSKAEPVAVEEEATPKSGKGRPTPTRKEAEAAHKRPLGGVGTRTATGAPAAKQTKEERKAAREEARRRYELAMQRGDERYMPARDKGPVRRWVRDYIDSRRSLGEYVMVGSLVALLILMIGMQAFPLVALYMILAMYLLIFVVIGDLIVRSRRLKKALIEKFGEDRIGKGTVWYGMMRSMQIRRSRMPKPQVERGQYPK
jgi:hypothetical protein